MVVLLGASVALMIALACMTAYVWRHPLDMSRGGLRHLRKGLALASASSVLLVAAYALWMVATPSGLDLAFILLAIAGNLGSATSLIYGLHEFNQESVVAGMLMGTGQMLWVLFGVFVVVFGRF